MQRAEDSSPRLQPESKQTASIRPIQAFAILLVLAAAAAGFIYLSRPAPTLNPGTHSQGTSANFTLTDAEAIVRFQELNDLRIAMYEKRDLSLVDGFLSSDSELRDIAAAEIRQLVRDKVTVTMGHEIKSAQVVSNDSNVIKIQTTIRETVVFRSEKGEDVTASKPTRRHLEWTLVLEDSVWLLQDLEVLG